MAFTTKQYLRAFRALQQEGLAEKHLELVRAHYAAPSHTATWAQLAKAVGYAHGKAVNLQYGRFAARVGSQLGLNEPPNGFWLHVIADWAEHRDPASGHTPFVLRKPVIKALIELGVISVPALPAEDYVHAFRSLAPLAAEELQILRAHYQSPSRVTSARRIAEQQSYRHYSRSNLIYGRLGRRVGRMVGSHQRLGSLVTFSESEGEWFWTMRPQVAAALEILGWVGPIDAEAEEHASSPHLVVSSAASFKPGLPLFATSTTATLSEGTVDVDLKHKALQSVLFECLAREYGSTNVAIEHSLEYGVRVDAAARSGDELHFYELKTGESVQACVRAAIGQLLEYSHWPGTTRAARLIVTGELPADETVRTYMALLRRSYNLPLWYREITDSPSSLGAWV